MEDNKNIPENNEPTAEKTVAGAKKPLPKSTLIVGAVAAVIIIALTVALILALGSKKPDNGSVGNENENQTENEPGNESENENERHSFGEWTLYNEDETDCEKKRYSRTCSDCSAIEWKDGKYEDHVWGTEYISDASQQWKK